MKDFGFYTMQSFDKLKGNNDILDIVEGCLLDSVLYYDEKEKAYIVAIEQATTTWTSALHVYSGDEKEVFDMWNNFKETAAICQ